MKYKDKGFHSIAFHCSYLSSVSLKAIRQARDSTLKALGHSSGVSELRVSCRKCYTVRKAPPF